VSRVALVTGAARGIGAACALALARSGWSLVLVDRAESDPDLAYPLASREELARVADQCGRWAEAAALAVDVRDQQGLGRAAHLALERFGGLDAAVAAAGAMAGGPPLWETSEAAWSSMMGVNAEGVWRLCKAAVPVMLARPEPRSGRFVAIASAAATTGLERLGAYCAAKHACLGLVRALAADLAPFGITANAVAPGSTAGAMLEATAAIYGIAPEELARHHMLGRLLEPEETAALVAWICGEDSGGITGALLPVDAGMTAR